MEEPWAKKFHGCACGIRNEGAFGFRLLLIASLLSLLIDFLPLFWEGGWFMVGDLYIYKEGKMLGDTSCMFGA